MQARVSTQFTSELGREYSQTLERLVFFNPNQAKLIPELESVVREYGSPAIEVSGNHLKITTTKLPDLQTLFVLKDSLITKLAGVVVYIREGNALRVLFFALDPRIAYLPGRQDCVLGEILDQMRLIGGQIKGVDWLVVHLKKTSVTLRVSP